MDDGKNDGYYSYWKKSNSWFSLAKIIMLCAFEIKTFDNFSARINLC